MNSIKLPRAFGPPSRVFGDEYWEPNPWGSGAAHAVDAFSAPRDLVAELHQVVHEVTGKPVVRPSRRIGFLP